MTRLERLATRAAVFLAGAMLMAAEIAALRIVAKTFGSALRETTAVIAVFLTAMSIGYWAGGRVGDRSPRTTTLIAALLLAAMSLLCVPWLDALVLPRIAASTLGLGFHAFAASALLFAIPTVFFASISPIAVRLFTTTAKESGSTAGSISALSTIGSIAGTVVTAFFLLDWLKSISRTVTFVALIACATAAMLMLASIPRLVKSANGGVAFRRLAVAIAAVVVLIGVPAATFMRPTEIDASSQHPSGWKVLFSGDSAYHSITVRERNARTRVLAFGPAVQSMMDVADPFGHGAPYCDSFHIGRLIRPNTRRVLSIGLGGGTAAKQFTRYYPDVSVDAVEVDPMVVDVAERFFDVRPSDRLRIHIGDGRTFLRRTSERWDLVIVDTYTTNRYGVTIPPHLITREFFMETAQHLNPGGIVHFHCAFGQTKILPALQKTMESVFESTVTTGGEILASNVPIIVDNDVLAARAQQSPAARLPNLLPYIRGLHPVRPSGNNIPLLTDDYAPIDTLLRQRL